MRTDEPWDVIVVLGFRQRPDGRPSVVQRWRVEIALSAAGPETRLLFSGGGGEAETMAEVARSSGFDAARIVLERASISTWENVGLSAALIPEDSVVRFASDPLHAARARDYWTRQVPSRAAELGPALPALGWRHPLLMAGAGLYELVLRAYRGPGRPRRPR